MVGVRSVLIQRVGVLEAALTVLFGMTKKAPDTALVAVGAQVPDTIT